MTQKKQKIDVYPIMTVKKGIRSNRCSNIKHPIVKTNNQVI